MPLYFAYGSNMGAAQMLLRCPQSTRLGQASLPAHRWIIAGDGYASVIPDSEHRVEGVLFEISDADETALDHFEEVHLGCYTKTLLPIDFQHTSRTALVYRNSSEGTGQPAPEYVSRLLLAIADARPDPAYTEFIMRSITSGNPG